jgi:hypothetical protein
MFVVHTVHIGILALLSVRNEFYLLENDCALDAYNLTPVRCTNAYATLED